MARRTNKVVHARRTSTSVTLSAAEEQFIYYCRMRNLRPESIVTYTKHLRQFRRMVIDSKKFPEDVSLNEFTAHDINYYVIRPMMDAGYKTSSINSTIRVLKTFFGWAERSELIEVSPMDTVPKLKESQTVIETFSNDQIKRLLRAPDRQTFSGLRDYVIMTIMLDTGIRVSELRDIEIRNIDFTANQIRLSRTKNGKERMIPISTDTKKLIQQYLKERGVLEHDWLFISLSEEKLSTRSIQSSIQKYGKQAGVKNVRVSPHTFRHTFAKLAVMNGANVFDLQSILGHSSLDMVRRYVNLYSSDISDSHRKFSPISNLK